MPLLQSVSKMARFPRHNKSVQPVSKRLPLAVLHVAVDVTRWEGDVQHEHPELDQWRGQPCDGCHVEFLDGNGSPIWSSSGVDGEAKSHRCRRVRRARSMPGCAVSAFRCRFGADILGRLLARCLASRIPTVIIIQCRTWSD